MNRYLTKSRFKLAIECPTKLYYTGKSAYTNLKQDDAFLQALADGGFQVGELAKHLFPGGIEITETSHDAAEARTQELLSTRDDVVLFEPAIRFGNLFIRIDILVKQGNTFELIEVKAKSYDSLKPTIMGARGAISSAMLPYIEDVAFQTYVLKCAYPDARVTSYLMMPDKTVCAQVDGLNRLFKVRRQGRRAEVMVDPLLEHVITEVAGLLAKVPVDACVDMVMQQGIALPGSTTRLTLPEAACLWAHAYVHDERVLPLLHKGCAKCEFRDASGQAYKSGFHECLVAVTGLTVEEIDQGTVLDLWNYRNKDDLLARGIYRYTQMTDKDIKAKPDATGLSRTERQLLQIKGLPTESQAQGFYLDRPLMAQAISTWTYPLHMIDFETATVALPFFKGMRPYASIAFQFSHHVIEKDGSVRHAGQFLLAEPGVFPNIDFVRALKRELQADQGTIFRWAAHENTILNHIKTQIEALTERLPEHDELIGFINEITNDGSRAMVDLAQLAQRAYFHPDTQGSVSIKKTLPAVLKTSPYLKEKYQAPIYGTDIPSLNFRAVSWWQPGDQAAQDPYARLEELAQDMLGETPNAVAALEGIELDTDISQGGAAAMAFARLQFEDMSETQRSLTKAALLRYCELDTLAMVMITEAWREWAKP